MTNTKFRFVFTCGGFRAGQFIKKKYWHMQYYLSFLIKLDGGFMGK